MNILQKRSDTSCTNRSSATMSQVPQVVCLFGEPTKANTWYSSQPRKPAALPPPDGSDSREGHSETRRLTPKASRRPTPTVPLRDSTFFPVRDVSLLALQQPTEPAWPTLRLGLLPAPNQRLPPGTQVQEPSRALQILRASRPSLPISRAAA